MITKETIHSSISRERSDLPYLQTLSELLLLPSSVGKAGYPILSEKAFSLFLNHIPHLFSDGRIFLEVLADIEYYLSTLENDEQKEHILRSLAVLKRVTLTAAVTSPSDLWLLRQLFSSYQQINLSDYLIEKKSFDIESIAKEKNLNIDVLKYDFDFLASRGYLKKEKNIYQILESSYFTDFVSLDEFTPRNMVYPIVQYFVGSSNDKDMVENFFSYKKNNKQSQNWVASYHHIQIGFRLLPLVLAARYLELHSQFKEGTPLSSIAIKLSKGMKLLLNDAGVLKKDGQHISLLGERIFSRGPGPYGIIHAYHSYMKSHGSLLTGKDENVWVARGENVSASQDANAKSFKQINDALDRFSKQYDYQYTTFIEHAVGQGEATRQRFELSGEETIQYYGADLEDSAIEKAQENQAKGILPKNMKFIHHADIGRPEILIEGITKTHGGNLDRAVMVVGNGFHEVRNQNNESMIDVFKGYKEAGIILLFTEESGLTNEDLLSTGWNTYHAGFRYVHELSGQGLRPAIDTEEGPQARFSWRKCAQLAGYQVLEDFTTRTRKVYPHPQKDGYNPSISVNYFCVPEEFFSINS